MQQLQRCIPSQLNFSFPNLYTIAIKAMNLQVAITSINETIMMVRWPILFFYRTLIVCYSHKNNNLWVRLIVLLPVWDVCVYLVVVVGALILSLSFASGLSEFVG